MWDLASDALRAAPGLAADAAAKAAEDAATAAKAELEATPGRAREAAAALAAETRAQAAAAAAAVAAEARAALEAELESRVLSPVRSVPGAVSVRVGATQKRVSATLSERQDAAVKRAERVKGGVAEVARAAPKVGRAVLSAVKDEIAGTELPVPSTPSSSSSSSS